MLERVEERCTAMNRLAARLYAALERRVGAVKLPRRASVAAVCLPKRRAGRRGRSSSIDRRERGPAAAVSRT